HPCGPRCRGPRPGRGHGCRAGWPGGLGGGRCRRWQHRCGSCGGGPVIEELADGDLLVEQRESALHVTFNRPRARNAMTNAMYDALVTVCERADADETVRSVVLRGAGDRAFVAGTDITQFRGFTGEDGIAYEERIA